VTVVNAAPNIDGSSGDATIAEGSSIQLAVTATDPGPTDALTFDWDLDGDGLYDERTEQPGTGTQASTVDMSWNDDGVQNAAVRVSDGEGGVAFASFVITVQNVPPTLHFLTPDVHVDADTPFELEAVAMDPSTADELTFHWELDGDGQYDDAVKKGGKWVGQSSVFPSLPRGQYVLGVRVVDDDGGEAIGTLTAYVGAPEASLLPAASPLGRAVLGLALLTAALLLALRNHRRAR